MNYYKFLKIKEEYGDILTQEKFQKLDNIKVEIINDENYEQDFFVEPKENKLIINMYYLGRDKGKNIHFNDKILLALGSLPHEIFHFLIEMLSQEDDVK